MRAKIMMKGTLDVVLMGVLMLNLVLLAGCGNSNGSGGGGGGTILTGALAAGGATDIYVIEGEQSGTGNTILDFAVDSSTNATPKGTLIVPTALFVRSVATDSAGQIYVGGDLANGLNAPTEEILVYAAGATGSATPLRTITLDGSGASLVYPGSMTVDAAGVIYATGPGGNVGVIAAGANGETTPERLLTSGDLTGPVGIAVDAAGEIFVANETLEGPGDDYVGGSILVFASGANGRDAPTRVITGPAPTATADNAFFGIAVDSAGDITTVFDTETYDTSGNETGTSAVVQEFSAGATGTATPTKMISGASTALTFGGGLKVDGAGNLYLVDASGLTTTTPTFSVLGFGPNATGDVAPGLRLSSNSWTTAGSEIALK